MYVCMYTIQKYSSLITQTVTKTSIRHTPESNVTFFFLKCGHQNFHMMKFN